MKDSNPATRPRCACASPAGSRRAAARARPRSSTSSDRSGRIQLHARADVLGKESLDALVALDLGDLLGADGTIFKTRRGELSVKVDGWQLLAKSLRPPPDKHHGLDGHRDAAAPPRARSDVQRGDPRASSSRAPRSSPRSGASSTIEGFIEVETPVLQPIYGGALARPFTTHFNALDRTMYLRIATELYLKRLIVGGLERVYEIGKDFRNEGLSPKHNPEFTMLEWYEAYADWEVVADRAERLVRHVARGGRLRALRAALGARDAGRLDRDPPGRRWTCWPTGPWSRCRARCASAGWRSRTSPTGRRSSTSSSPSTSSRR